MLLSTLKWLYEAYVLVGSEVADDALDTAAHALWKSGLLEDLISRASKLYRPPPA